MVNVPDEVYINLYESAEMYRTLVETSPDAVTATDLEGRITVVSKRTLELHGYRDERELIGKSAFELIAPEDHERAMANLKKTLTEGSVQNIEYALLRRDSSRFIGELSASLIKNGSGDPKAFIATTRDISWRKKMEETLRESEELYRTLAEAAQEFIFILDAERKIRYLNHFAASYVRSSPEKIIGKKLDEFIPAGVLDRAKWDLQKIFDDGQTIATETRLNLFGVEMWLETRLVPLKDREGRVKSVLGISRDMTKYKLIEDELMKKISELKEFNDQAVGRELKLIELEREIERLKQQIIQNNRDSIDPTCKV